MSNGKQPRRKSPDLRTYLVGLALVILAALLTGQAPEGLLDVLTGQAPATASAPAPEAATPQPGASDATEASATEANAPEAAAPTASPTRPESRSGLPVIRYRELPPEAQETIQRIRQGGPFPFRKDGSVFQNREGLLPSKPRGYYREYTVITPGEDDRGARRIVAGEGGELYYTEDHYNSFWEVVETVVETEVGT